jgi:hypothetical protein
MPFSEMLRRVALVRTDVSEERVPSIIKVTRIGELRTSAVTSKPTDAAKKYYVISRRFLQEPHAYIPEDGNLTIRSVSSHVTL